VEGQGQYVRGVERSLFLRIGGVLLEVLAGLLLAFPSRAGQYELSLDNVQGNVTITDAFGTQNTPLSDANYESNFLFGASLSYTCTETYSYEWVADSTLDSDPPVAETQQLTATASLDLASTSSVYYYGGGGSASAGMGGPTASASASTVFVEDGSGGHYEDAPGNTSGSCPIYKSVSLSGWSGTFTVTYTGSLTVSGGIQGRFTMQRTGGGTSKYIYIQSPKHGAQFSTGAGSDPNDWVYINIVFDGKWKEPAALAGRRFYVRTYSQFVTLPLHSNNPWDSWASTQAHIESPVNSQPGGTCTLDSSTRFPPTTSDLRVVWSRPNIESLSS
jgi:hypothetical protein